MQEMLVRNPLKDFAFVSALSLSLSLSQILHFMTLKFLRRWFFFEEEQVEELGFVMD
jgi:hypothetical protein